MQITPNFHLREFTHTNTGLPNEPPRHIVQFIKAFARLLQHVRGILGKPLYINSCYRSPAVNHAVGGSRTSFHLKGCACDLSIVHYTPDDLVTLERALNSYYPIEFIKYDTFWHVAYDFNHLGNADYAVSTYEQDYPDLRDSPRTIGDF